MEGGFDDSGRDEGAVRGDRAGLCRANYDHMKRVSTSPDAIAPSRRGERDATLRKFTIELGNRIKITIEGPSSVSENVLTQREAHELRDALIAAIPVEPDTRDAQIAALRRELQCARGYVVKARGPMRNMHIAQIDAALSATERPAS